MSSFNAECFREVWNGIPEKTKQAIRDKANWEHMTLSAVMKNWWPELWSRVADKDAKERE